MTESMTSGWYYGREGSLTGPLSWEELHAAGASGAFGPADLVWHEGYADWVPAAQVPGLLGATASTSQVPGRPLWLLPAMVLVAAVLVGVGLGLYFGLNQGDTGLVIDQTSAANMEVAEFDRLVTDAGERLITQLSGDVAASCAVLLALDRGYDAYQLLTGALNDRVEADGRILAVDGSVLAPARPAEGFIEITADPSSGGGEARTGFQAEPILLASLSGLVLADETTFPEYWAKNARVFENRRTLLELLGVFEDHGERMRQQEEREALRTQQALEEEAKRKAQEEQRKREAAWNRAKTNETLICLINDGYSAEQILEAVLLGKCEPTWPDELTHVYWRPTHPSGGVLRPVHQPVMLSGGPRSPVVDPSAPTDYDPKDIEVALAGGDPDTTTTQPQPANTPPAAEDITTSTVLETPIPITLKGTDADGDDLTYTYEQPANGVAEGAPPFLTYTPADGFAGAADTFTYTVSDGEATAVGTVRIEVEELRYLGEVGILSKSPLPVYRLDHSSVELVVAGSAITATVEFTLVAVLKWDSDDYLCTATMHRVYRGQGPRQDSVSIELELVDSSDVLEGPDQEGVKVPVIQSQVLEGTFSDDGTFTGSIRDVWAIGAARVE